MKYKYICICGFATDAGHVMGAHKARCQKWQTFALETRDDIRIQEDAKTKGVPAVAKELNVTPSQLYEILAKPRHKKKHDRPKAMTATQAITSSWEQIIKVIPDTATLGIIVVDGFMAKLQECNTEKEELREQLKSMTEDRKRIMQELNERLTKERTGGHFTIDQVRHQIVPKERG